MLRALRALSFSYRVVKRSNGPGGLPLPNMDLFYLTDDSGKELSFWNDLPYNLQGDVVTCCIQVPKEISNKYEVIKEMKNHPFMQDTKKNVFTKQEELRYYAQFPLFNYGFIPRTWEQTLTKDDNGYLGDDDPIDVCDLSIGKKEIGSVFRAKVLGCFCLIDQGEVDWKVFMVDAEEADRQNIHGLWNYPEEYLRAIMQWFKTIKIFDGKKANTIAFEEQILSKDATLNIIRGTHVEWKKLVGSSDPVYLKYREKFHLKDFKLDQ